jgi:hypothetical protein
MRCCTSVVVWLSLCVGAVLGADESSSLVIAADLKSRGLSVSRATVKSAGGGLAIDVQRDVVYGSTVTGS